jgi:hypothetical protein
MINHENKEKIMANKKIWLGMLVTVLAFGMTVVGCGGDGDGDGDSDDGQKTITVTGIPNEVGGINHTGMSQIRLYSGYSISADRAVAWGSSTLINKGSVTWYLDTTGYVPFTGSGPYYLEIAFSDFSGNWRYFAYTDGKTTPTSLDDAVKYNVSSTNKIAFNKFADVTDFFD